MTTTPMTGEAMSDATHTTDRPAIKLDHTTEPRVLIDAIEVMERCGWRPEILDHDDDQITVRLSIIGVHRQGGDHVDTFPLDEGARKIHAAHMAEHGDDRDADVAWKALDDHSRNLYRRLARRDPS